MSTSKHIVCAIEPNSESKELAEIAAKIAHQNECDLTFIHVVAPIWHPYMDLDMAAISQAQASMEASIIEQARNHLSTLAASVGVAPDQIVIKTGDPVAEIVEYAEELDCQMIILGVHNRRGLRRLLGSTAHGILNGTDKPIWLVHTSDLPNNGYKNILIAVDTSDAMPTVLNSARPYIDQATQYQTLSVVESLVTSMDGLSASAFAASWPIADIRTDLKKAVNFAVREGCEKAGLSLANIVIAEGDPAHAICKAAKDQSVDLIIMGSGTRNIVDRILLGSTAHGVLNNTPCDVFIAR